MAEDEDVLNRSSVECCVFTGFIDQRIERVLWHLAHEPKKDVVSELIDDFDLDELLVAREKLYEHAKVRVEQMTHNGVGDVSRSSGKSDSKTKMIANPWQLIKRRLPVLASGDVCDLYLYVMKMDDNFPTRILKRKAMTQSDDGIAQRLRFDLGVIHEDSERSLSNSAIDTTVGSGEIQGSEFIQYGVEGAPLSQIEDPPSETPYPIVNMDANSPPPAAANYTLNIDTSLRNNDMTIETLNISVCISEMNVSNEAILNASTGLFEQIEGSNAEPHNGGHAVVPACIDNIMTNILESVVKSVEENSGEKALSNSFDTNECEEMNSASKEGDCVYTSDNRLRNIQDAQNTDDASCDKSAQAALDSIMRKCTSDNPAATDTPLLQYVVTPSKHQVRSAPMSTANQQPAGVMTPRAVSIVKPETDTGLDVEPHRPEQMLLVEQRRPDNALTNVIPDGVVRNVSYVMFGEPDFIPEPPSGQPNNYSDLVEQKSGLAPHTVDAGFWSVDGVVGNDMSLSDPSSVMSNRNAQMRGVPSNCFNVRAHSESQCEAIITPIATSYFNLNLKAKATSDIDDSINKSTLSQESFMREIDEIHKRLTSSSPKAPTPKQSTTDMATQTDTSVAPDRPVRRTEYECQMDYIERAITDHERRTRSLEVSVEKNERKVDKADAEYYTQLKMVHNTQERIATEVVKVSDLMKVMIDNQECMKRVPTLKDFAHGGHVYCDNKEKDRGKWEQLLHGTRPVQEFGPTQVSCEKKTVQKGASTYDNFMRAAVKVLPSSKQQKGTSLFPFVTPQCSLPSKESTRVTTELPRSRAGGTPTTRDGCETPRQVASTPKAPNGGTNVSWAEVEDFDDIVVDEFIASVVIDVDKNCERDRAAVHGGKQLRAPATQAGPKIMDGNGGTKQSSSGAVPKVMNGGPKPTHGGARSKQGYGGLQPTKTISSAPGVTATRPSAVPSGPHPTKEKLPADAAAANGVLLQIRGNHQQREQNPGKMSNDNIDKASNDVTPRADPTPAESAGASYAKVVGKNGWSSIPYGKRRRTRSSPRAIAPLRGAQVKQNRDVYVRGLERMHYKSSEEVEDAVFFYCRDRGVEVLYAKEIKNRFESHIACVKITVSESNMQIVLDEEFWPEDVEVRQWYQNNRSRRPSRAYPDEGNF